MSYRYDDFRDFYNPTEKDFVGRWEMEDYLIPAQETMRLPTWLATHFAKRLCDTVMIHKYGEPLRHNDKKRKKFMEMCLPGHIVSFDKDRHPKTTKEQIMSASKNVAATAEERMQQLQEQMQALQEQIMGEDESDEPVNLTPRKPGVSLKEPANKSLGAMQSTESDDFDVEPDESDEPFDDDKEEGEPLTLTEKEKQLKEEIAKEYKEVAKVAKKAKGTPLKKTGKVSKEQPIEDDEIDKPEFAGDITKADSKMQKSLQTKLKGSTMKSWQHYPAMTMDR